MVRFSFRSWLNCVAPGHSARNRRLTPHRIERLEERLVLSAYSVTSTLDSVDANPGDGVAADVNGNATLRAAVIDANALTGTDTITLGSGVFTLTLSGLNENAAATGDLDVTGDLVIEGAGADQTFLDAALLDRYFHVQPGSSLTLRNLTIRNGREVNGGAIENDGTLVLENVDLTGNAAVMRGGAIYNLAGNVTLQSVHVTGNQALGNGDAIGGGLVSTGGSVTIVDSQFSNNAAAMEGGAINSRTTTLQVTNTAFSNNSANSGGAIRLFSGTASLTNNTFSGDHATTSGGAISSGSCTLTITGGSFTGNYLAPMPPTGAVRTGGVLYLSGAAPSGVTIKYVTFQQTGSGDGGAIYNSNGALSLSYSTFDRVTGDRGGAIWNGNSGFISMWNTTIAGGSGTNGGAIFNTSGGQLQVRNSTISDTTSTGVPGEGGEFFTAFGGATTGLSSVINSGAVHNAGGGFTSLNNLIAGNVGGLDVYGSFSSSGGNLIGNGTGGYGFTAPTDHVGTAASPINPLLSPLANNGGQVQTMAISAQSPARDGGTFGAPQTDARGLPRTGLAPDAGAYEYQNRTPVAGPFNVTTNEDQVLTGQLAGSDADGDTLTYEVTMPAFIGTLSVLPNGQFTYTPQPDFAGTVTFRYRVSDGGSYSNEVVGRIVVQPVNDPPVVANQTFTIAENSPNGSFVGFVEAFDIDSFTLTGQIISGNESGIFGLSSQTRALYVTNSSLLNFETTPIVTLVVRITGDGTPATSTLATITIHLTDANDAPKLPQQTIIYVDENSPNGTVVGTIPATDEDAGQSLTYEFADSNVNGPFAINPATGQITVIDEAAVSVEYQTSWGWMVRVTDNGNPALSTEAWVFLRLRNVNDPPTVADQSFTIAENSQYGSFVGHVEATDADGYQLTGQIVSGNENGAFAFNSYDRTLYVANPSLLNFETNPTITLVVRISDGGSPVGSNLATITVNLLDVNEPPHLQQVTIFNVDENSPNGTVVGTLAASDDDVGQSLTYGFDDGNVNGPFAINPVTGQVTVIDAAAVSGEYPTEWAWTVRVTDNGDPALSTLTWMVIRLHNVNDAPTVADQTFTIAENSSNGAFVGHIEASDPDGNQLTGTIISGNENGAFSFNSYDRTLTIADSSLLNFETNPTFTLVVQISDNANPAGLSLATITINLADINELPQPAAAAFTVDENATNGTVLGTVTSTDPDVGQTLTFAIAASNTPGAFAIDPATGQVTVADGSLLNFESPASYSFLVSVTDSGTPALTQYAAVTIQVNDVNEAPQIAPSAFSLDENSSNGTVVGTVSGSDPDAGQSLTYAITSGNTNGAFAIDAVTGQITVANAAGLNFEATSTFNLVVSVADNSTPSLASNAAVTITLNDRNEAPQISAQSFAVAENSANSTVVGTVSASDPDAGQSLTYSITSGNTNGAFAINAATGQITISNAAALNFEATTTFNLVVSVADSSTPSLASSAAVTITLTNVNEAPAISPRSFSLVENSANGTVVGTITGTDPDAGQPLTYSITSGNAGGAFAINPATGQITVANSALLDFETTPSFSLVVSITDDGTPSLTASATVAISLQNANDAPLFVNKSFTLSENSANATVVGTITATDADPGQTLTYAIISGNTNGAFSINATTGQIRVASSAALNFEVTPVFNLVIRATDNGTPSQSSTATATISLANVNEAPQISAQSFSVAENSANGTLVAAVAGFDPDAGQPLTYSIVSGNTNGAFSINATTGQITVANAAALNFEATTAFNLVVRIADNGTPSLTASATVSISVTNVNEAPLFPAKSFTLSENSANGTVVGTTTATDPDAGQSRTYSIVSGNPNGAFSINATTGQIRVANSAALNFETNPVFSLVVRATDNGTPSASTDTTMTITLTNVNETPLIAAQSFSVAENSANGTVVGSVVASDPDAGQSLTYSITSGNTNSAFTINAATGKITVANVAALDFETRPTFTLQVRVTDNGSPTRTSTATVTISLSDVLEPLAVAIDVVPGSSSNTIRLGRTFELAILSTSSFDARNVNVATVRFGELGTENSATRNSQGQVNYSYRDVNNDGRLDLVLEISTDATGLLVGDTLARFTGSLNNGQTLVGSSSVVVRR